MLFFCCFLLFFGGFCWFICINMRVLKYVLKICVFLNMCVLKCVCLKYVCFKICVFFYKKQQTKTAADRPTDRPPVRRPSRGRSVGRRRFFCCLKTNISLYKHTYFKTHIFLNTHILKHTYFKTHIF